jgi:hypothetical protein
MIKNSDRSTMSETFSEILRLVERGEGYPITGMIAADGLFAKDATASVPDGIVVEDYPEYPKGRCVLVLQKDRWGKPMHVVWGIPKGSSSPAVLITEYRPDPTRWEADFRRRRA